MKPLLAEICSILPDAGDGGDYDDESQDHEHEREREHELKVTWSLCFQKMNCGGSGLSLTKRFKILLTKFMHGKIPSYP